MFRDHLNLIVKPQRYVIFDYNYNLFTNSNPYIIQFYYREYPYGRTLGKKKRHQHWVWLDSGSKGLPQVPLLTDRTSSDDIVIMNLQYHVHVVFMLCIRFHRYLDIGHPGSVLWSNTLSAKSSIRLLIITSLIQPMKSSFSILVSCCCAGKLPTTRGVFTSRNLSIKKQRGKPDFNMYEIHIHLPL